MSVDESTLVHSWRQMKLDSTPYIFPDDTSLPINPDHIFTSLDKYVDSNSFGGSVGTQFHLGLLPIPYMGNLHEAKIYLLMLNPGFHAGDYFAEYQVADFRQAIIHNLHQENLDDEYPFLFLNPRFAWHPGFGYWHRKLAGVIKKIQEFDNNVSYQSALSTLAKQIATLELVPYHSTSFSWKGCEDLQSVKLMNAYVKNTLVPQALAGKIKIIATRSADEWGLPDHGNITIYRGGATRAAYLTPSSDGGKAILQQLGVS